MPRTRTWRRLSTAALFAATFFAIALQSMMLHPFARILLAPDIAQAAGGALGDPCIAGLPCGGIGNIGNAIVKIINVALGLVAIIAVAVIIIAGFRLIISQGENVDAARKAIIYAVVGILVILLAGTIVNLAITLL